MKGLSILALALGGLLGWLAAGAIANRLSTTTPAALLAGFLGGLVLLPMLWRVWRR